MSDILYCLTDYDQFTHNKFHQTFLYQVSALMSDKPDVFGLQMWEDEDKVDWEKYKLVWVHLNPRIMNPFWYQYPRLIRDRIGDTTMIISHEYLEKYYDIPMEFQVRNALTYCDYVHVFSKMAKEILEAEEYPVTDTNITQPIPDYNYEFPEPLSFDEKEGIVVVDHSVDTNYIPMFETLGMCSKIGLPITILTSNHTKDADWCKRLMDVYKVDATVYARLPWKDYMDKLNEARVALELGYTGISRMSYECAKVHTPVIGHDRLEYRNILYPEATVSKSSEACTALSFYIHFEDSWKHLNMYADNVLLTMWSIDSVNQRYHKLLKQVGYE